VRPSYCVTGSSTSHLVSLWSSSSGYLNDEESCRIRTGGVLDFDVFLTNFRLPRLAQTCEFTSGKAAAPTVTHVLRRMDRAISHRVVIRRVVEPATLIKKTGLLWIRVGRSVAVVGTWTCGPVPASSATARNIRQRRLRALPFFGRCQYAVCREHR